MKIEDMNFELHTKNFLLRHGYKTLDDLLKINYDYLANDKTLFNSVVNKVHKYGKMMDFEINYFSILKKRLNNGEHIRIDDLYISTSTINVLNNIGIDYVEELSSFNENMYGNIKPGIINEIEFLINILGIVKKTNSQLIKKYNIELSNKTKSELRAFNIENIKDCLYMKENIKKYLSEDTKKEIEELLEYLYGSNGIKPIEIQIDEKQEEITKLEKTINKKEKLIKKLEELQNKKEYLERHLKEVNKTLQKTINSANKIN